MISLIYPRFYAEKLVRNSCRFLSAIFLSTALCAALSSCKHEDKDEVDVPKAKKVEYSYEVHGVTISDDYNWLRDKSWPEVDDEDVLEYLNSENDYFNHHIEDIKSQENEIFQELVSRIQEDDESVPSKEDDYYYYTFIRKGQSYSTFVRKYKTLDSDPQVILDQNELAKGHDYFALGSLSVSSDHKILAYSTDTQGNERYTIYLKDLEKNEMLDDKIANAIGQIIWHESGSGFFYAKVDENWRSRDIFFHKLGTPSAQDILIYHENDEVFSARVGKTSSKEYIIISSSSSLETEKYYLSAQEEDFELKLIKKREPNIRFGMTHHGDSFYFNINDKGNNFRVIKVPVSSLSGGDWEQYSQEVFGHSDDKYIESLTARKNFFVLESKVLGLEKIEIFDTSFNLIKELEFVDQAYQASSAYTEFSQDVLRYNYSSPRTPYQVLEYDLNTGKTAVLKEQVIPSGFDSSAYALERKWVKARDGVMVPITILYKKQFFAGDGSNPLYLYGYGSYGISTPQYFISTLFSLVDKGFVYVNAGIRGGDDLGEDWHEVAKFGNKKVTFYDFIDVADYLVESGYTNQGNITISGGSAGGMLVGFCLNERPELYKAAVMHVPFVDVLNTMLDASLPLTPGEFKEWGNPIENKEIFEYIKSYSPYDNIKEQHYPNIFVTAGLSDPRVTYWEPAKYVAKLRELKTDDNLLLFKVNMGAGHAGKSGRYDRLHEIAEEYNVILNVFYKDEAEAEDSVEDFADTENLDKSESDHDASQNMEQNQGSSASV